MQWNSYDFHPSCAIRVSGSKNIIRTSNGLVGVQDQADSALDMGVKREGSSSSQSEVEKEDLAADFIPEDFNMVRRLKKKKDKRFGSLREIQDRVLSDTEKKRRDRGLRRIRKKKSEKTTLEMGETSLSSSDMRFRREVLIREARNTIEFGKQIGFEVDGDSEEAVLDMDIQHLWQAQIDLIFNNNILGLRLLSLRRVGGGIR
ncbi:hypothetical protein GQ457_05G032330 [Hibiscus cannabinus]